MSRFWSHRAGTDDALPQPTIEEDGIPFYGPDPYGDQDGAFAPYGADFSDGGIGEEEPGEEDIATMAREARMMAQMMGEPLDDAFDTALRHVERGADPDEVFGELDAAEAANEPSDPDSNP